MQLRWRTPDFAVMLDMDQSEGQSRFALAPIAILELKRFRWHSRNNERLQQFWARSDPEIAQVIKNHEKVFGDIEEQMSDQATFAIQGGGLQYFKGLGICGPFFRRYMWMKQGPGVVKQFGRSTRCIWSKGSTTMGPRFLRAWEWLFEEPEVSAGPTRH